MRTRILTCKMGLLALLLLASAPASAAPGKKGAKPDASKVVVAIINGYRLTVGELEEKLKTLPPTVQMRIRKNRDKYINGIIQAELLYQEAVRRKFQNRPQVRKRILQAKRRIMIDEFVRREVHDKVDVSEKDLRDFFNSNKEKFYRKEAVTMSHIVLRSEKDAWDTIAELRRGASFSAVARERSVFGGTRDSGGMMGTAVRGELDKNIEAVAFRLPIGEVSEPISTPLGWQIIRITERTAPEEASFDDVKEDVKQLLIEIKRRDSYSNLVDDLKDRGKVVVYPDRYK
ncbi:MAG: peptidyl-prolyl cis-trans isomerase [bacterium]